MTTHINNHRDALNHGGPDTASTAPTPGQAPPIAPPIADEPQGAFTQVGEVSPTFRGPNTSPLVKTGKSRRRRPARESSGTGTPHVGPRRLARLRAELGDRDRAVLLAVERHRYLTTAHIQGLVFTGHASTETAARTARMVLARLQRDSLIRSLDRTVGGVHGGSSMSIWQLTPAGARLLHDGVSHYRTRIPTTRFLQHTLAIADAHLAIRSAAQRLGGSYGLQIEHEATRAYLNLGGGRVTSIGLVYEESGDRVAAR